MNTRRAYFAGSFYPENPKILREKIELYLSKVSLKTQIQPKILIVPHAGYDYSGQVAAYVYKQLTGFLINKVILVGCSHQISFKGLAIWTMDKWKTPLGEIYINEKLAQTMIDNDNVVRDINPHLREHSLEVQLPFLQIAIRNSFTILPIMLGEIDSSTLERFCKTIKQNLDSETVLIISSDFSHYPSYEIAKKVDKITIQSILTNDTHRFKLAIHNEMQQGYKDLVTCACGQQAIELGMMTAKNLKLKGELLKYANSGDVTGEYNQVVGYAAIAWGEKLRKY